MKDIYKRILLFTFLCIPTRFLFMYLSRKYQNIYGKYFIFVALLFSLAQFYLYINDLRKTGIEVFGADIWWNQLRPVHGVLYLLFSIYMYKDYEYAYIPLLLDIIIGIVSFTLYHNIGLNFY